MYASECALCLSAMRWWHRTTHLPNCVHRFHRRCAKKWKTPTCPLCRASTLPPQPLVFDSNNFYGFGWVGDTEVQDIHAKLRITIDRHFVNLYINKYKAARGNIRDVYRSQNYTHLIFHRVYLYTLVAFVLLNAPLGLPKLFIDKTNASAPFLDWLHTLPVDHYDKYDRAERQPPI